MRRSAVLFVAMVAIGCEPSRAVPSPVARPRDVLDAAVPALALADARPGVAPRPPAPAPALPPPIAVDHLRALGRRSLDEIASRFPVLDVDGSAKRAEIPALGTCERPTPDERSTIARAVAAADHNAKDAELMFGCKDPAGIVVDVVYDLPPPAKFVFKSVWRVVRASSTAATARITTLAQYTGLGRELFSEWAHAVTVATVVLVDLDGDGNHDAVIGRDAHEVGSSTSEVALSAWLSRAGRVASLGTVRDVVRVARAQPHTAPAPLVVRIEPMYENGEPSRYRCIEPTGVLDLCPAIEEARRVDRAVEIAGWFVTGHDYEPYSAKLPDRDLLAELLTVLAVAPAEQTALLAEVEPTKPEVRVAREIGRVLEPPRRFGEIEDKPVPPELRPGQLMAMLGDAPCTRATAAQAQAAVARITAWIAANDARVLIAHGDCPAGAPCRWGRPRKPSAFASCVTAQRGYYSVRWTYVDQYELLAHDALFFVDASTATLMTDAIAVGNSMTCAACEGPPQPQLRFKMYRHGTSLIAILLSDPYTSKPRSFAFAVDGKLTALPPPTDMTMWYQFARPNYTERGLEADDLIEIKSDTQDLLEYWRWDAGWKQVAAFPWPQPRTTPPTQEPVGAWLWQQQWHATAREFLTGFNPSTWASTPDYRADTQQALVIVGADPAVGARIAAIERAAHPTP